MSAGAWELEAAAGEAEAQQAWQRAEGLWRQLLQGQPEHGAGWHRLGKALAQQQRWAEALECQRRSCGRVPWRHREALAAAAPAQPAWRPL